MAPAGHNAWTLGLGNQTPWGAFARIIWRLRGHDLTHGREAPKCAPEAGGGSEEWPRSGWKEPGGWGVEGARVCHGGASGHLTIPLLWITWQEAGTPPQIAQRGPPTPDHMERPPHPGSHREAPPPRITRREGPPPHGSHGEAPRGAVAVEPVGRHPQRALSSEGRVW